MSDSPPTAAEPARETAPRRASGEQARQLLAAAAQHVLAHGFGDWSLRAIAPALGTSHRMLIYHFGSAELFWEEVLGEIRRLEQLRREAVLAGPADPGAKALAAWERFSAENYLPIIQLLFEIVPHALRDPERHQAFLQDVVGSWLAPLQKQFERELGLDPAEARLRARVQLATMRGLLMDLLVTRDSAETTAALRYFSHWLNRPAEGGAPPR